MSPENTMTADQFLYGGKAAHRVKGGRKAGRAGKEFEAELELAHAVYRARKVADIWKLPVATIAMPPGWIHDSRRSGICRILSERQRADYSGYLSPLMGAKAIVMEAKRTSEYQASLAIIRPKVKGKKSSGSGLAEHQLRALATAAEWGAMAALVWSNGDKRLVYMGHALTQLYDAYRLDHKTRVRASAGVQYPISQDKSAGAFHDWIWPCLQMSGDQVVRAAITPQAERQLFGAGR